MVFGCTPGFCLRLLILAYPRSDPRRTELIAELYTVPRIQRPLWVAEQLETALFEGLPHRLSAVLRWIARHRQARAKAGLLLLLGIEIVLGIVDRFLALGLDIGLMFGLGVVLG